MGGPGSWGLHHRDFYGLYVKQLHTYAIGCNDYISVFHGLAQVPKSSGMWPQKGAKYSVGKLQIPIRKARIHMSQGRGFYSRGPKGLFHLKYLCLIRLGCRMSTSY